jgi:hypothetical protein
MSACVCVCARYSSPESGPVPPGEGASAGTLREIAREIRGVTKHVGVTDAALPKDAIGARVTLLARLAQRGAGRDASVYGGAGVLVRTADGITVDAAAGACVCVCVCVYVCTVLMYRIDACAVPLALIDGRVLSIDERWCVCARSRLCVSV